MEKDEEYRALIPHIEDMGYKDIAVANVASLTDLPPWGAVTVGYYPNEEGYPYGLFIWAATNDRETIAHDELHEAAINEEVLAEDSENEIPPWGARFGPDQRGRFHMTERSSERRYSVDSSNVDHFIEYLNDLYGKLMTKRK